MQKRIILATNSHGKLIEFSSLLAEQPFTILSQRELSIPEVEETGLTFVENAILKARHASFYGNLPAIADDSGLMVDALNGAPGVYSARYAAESGSSKNTSSSDNIAKLLSELQEIQVERRSARFYCAIVYLRHTKDPAPIICYGIWEGVILFAPRGHKGFGYDPIFWVPTHNCTAAELPLEVKNQISHRGLAISRLMRALGIVA